MRAGCRKRPPPLPPSRGPAKKIGTAPRGSRPSQKGAIRGGIEDRTEGCVWAHRPETLAARSRRPSRVPTCAATRPDLHPQASSCKCLASAEVSRTAFGQKKRRSLKETGASKRLERLGRREIVPREGAFRPREKIVTGSGAVEVPGEERRSPGGLLPDFGST